MMKRRHHLDEQTEHDEHARSDPTWFLDSADLQQREELKLRYRRFRNLPDPAIRPSPSCASERPSYHAFVSAQARPPADFLDASDAAAEAPRGSVRARARRRELSLQQTFVVAAAMAVCAGGAVGSLSAQFGTLRQSLFGPERRLAEIAAPEKIVAATVIAKKPVATATLRVEDVAGKTNSLIPLALRVEPALAGQDLVLRLSGLPERAYLTSGRREDDQVWTLNLDDLKDLKLLVPDARQDSFEVDVAALERRSGELAAPVKTMTVALENVVIHPASAPAQGVKPPPKDRMGAHVMAIPAPASIGLGAAGGGAGETTPSIARRLMKPD